MNKTTKILLIGLLPFLALGHYVQDQHAKAATAVPPTFLYGPFPKLTAALGATPVALKAAPGQLVWYACGNSGMATAFVQVFDTTGAITLGMTTPKESIPIPSGVGVGSIAASFLAGIKVAATTTATGSSAASVDCSFGVF